MASLGHLKKTQAAPLRQARASHPCTLQVDDVLFGHDIDLSGDTALREALLARDEGFAGAAGVTSFLRAKRDEHGNVMQVKELVVKAHVVALVPDHSNPGKPLFRVDNNAFDYPAADLDAYMRALAAALLNHAVLPGGHEFRRWSTRVLHV